MSYWYTPSRRTHIPLATFATLIAMILIRLYTIQIIVTPDITHLAALQKNITVTLPGKRGLITDRNGRAIAYTREQLSACIARSLLLNQKDTLNYLKKKQPRVYNQLQKEKDTTLFGIEHDISFNRLRTLRSESSDIHGYFEPKRIYTSPHMAHITGYTNEKLEGIAGLEYWADKELTGQQHMSIMEPLDRDGLLYTPTHILQEGLHGKTIQTSLDQQLHFLIEHELETLCTELNSENGIALVMNPKTGEVIAAPQYPVINTNHVARFNRDERTNSIWAKSFEFGTLMTGLTALAYSEEQHASHDTRLDENTDLAHAVIFSKASAVSEMSKELNTLLYDHYARMGLSQELAIEYPEKIAGYLPSRDTWNIHTAQLVGFGYRSSITPLHVLNAYNIISNNGVATKPTLLKQETLPLGRKLYTNFAIDTTRTILMQAAQQYGLKLEGYTVLAKLGQSKKQLQKVSFHEDVYSLFCSIEKGDYVRTILIAVNYSQKRKAATLKKLVDTAHAIATRTALHETLTPHIPELNEAEIVFPL